LPAFDFDFSSLIRTTAPSATATERPTTTPLADQQAEGAQAVQNQMQHTRRFTRLTNSFSKKLENHMHAISLYFMFYNFCKIHKTLRVTPVMEGGISEKLWEISDIVKLIPEEAPKKRGSYKKRG